MMRSVLKMRQHDRQSMRGKRFYTMEISIFEGSWIIKLPTSMGNFLRDRSSINVHIMQHLLWGCLLHGLLLKANSIA